MWISKPNWHMLGKYRQSGVTTQDSSTRRISKLCSLSWVEAESENWRIGVESSIKSIIESIIGIRLNPESNIRRGGVELFTESWCLVTKSLVFLVFHCPCVCHLLLELIDCKWFEVLQILTEQKLFKRSSRLFWVGAVRLYSREGVIIECPLKW